MADVNYDNIPSIIGIYEGTVAGFEAIADKSNFYGRLILITGTSADKNQAMWTSEDDGTNAHYLNMSDVATLKAQLAHIDGIAFPKDGGSSTSYDKYDLTGGKGFIFKGSNGITVTINPSTSTTIDGKPYWSIEVNGETLKSSLIGTSGDDKNSPTIEGAKKYADSIGIQTTLSAQSYTDSQVNAAKTELKGTSSDTAASETIAGAKKYADEVAASKASAAKDEAIQASKDYVDPLLANKADLEGGKIKESQLPDFILGQMIFGGVITGGGANQMVVSVSSTFKDKYNITTDTVTIPKADAYKYEGTYFIVSESSGNVLDLDTAVGDWVVSNGSPVWYKIDNTDAVTTVVGQTGAITASQIDEAIANIASTTRKLATASEVNGKYTKPAGGIPATDMAENVQKNLDRASRAVVGVDSKGDFLDVTNEANTLEETVVYVEAKTAEITSETATTNGLATVADIRAYLAARFSVKVVS